MSDGAAEYDASRIEVLEGLEAIRKRPGMYVGSTGERGLHRLVFEVADRAVNEVLAGRAGRVDVTLVAGGGVRVTDDGHGASFETAEDASGPGLRALLTRVGTGAAPLGRDVVCMGSVGVGPCVANALSSRLTAEVRHGGVRWFQEYERGSALAPPTPTPAEPTAESGTAITFWPDPTVFETVECSFTTLAERFREVAFLNRGLPLSLTDERAPGPPRSARFLFPGGVRDFVASIGTRPGTPVPPDVIAFEQEDQAMAGTVEAALRWCDFGGERVLGFANSCPTAEGGTHVSGFREGVASAVDAYARQRGLLAATAPRLAADRVCEGLTAVVSVKLDRPEYEGCTRGRLGGTAVRDGVAAATRRCLGTWLGEQPERAGALIGRILAGAHRDRTAAVPAPPLRGVR